MLNNGATFRLLAVTKAASQVVKNKIFMVFASEQIVCNIGATEDRKAKEICNIEASFERKAKKEI